jgi:hypothetical protein
MALSVIVHATPPIGIERREVTFHLQAVGQLLHPVVIFYSTGTEYQTVCSTGAQFPALGFTTR